MVCAMPRDGNVAGMVVSRTMLGGAPELSVAFGCGHVTSHAKPATSLLNIISDGHRLHTGASVSRMVTLKAQVSVLAAASAKV